VTATTTLLQQLQHHPTTTTPPTAAVTKVLKAPATPTIAVRAMADMKIPTAPAAIPVRAAAAIPAAAILAENPPAVNPVENLAENLLNKISLA